MSHDDAAGAVVLLPDNDADLRIRFTPSRAPKTRQNSMHFDVTSTSLNDQWQTVARWLELGARHIDVGQRPEEGHVVLADPEGNEFCVIEPGNRLLAECGILGAVACDGTRAVGHFWSEALGWPLVWDQDLQTAVRSPAGRPTWALSVGALSVGALSVGALSVGALSVGVLPIEARMTRAGSARSAWSIPMATSSACCLRDSRPSTTAPASP